MKQKTKEAIKRIPVWSVVEPFYRKYKNHFFYDYNSYSQMGEDIVLLNLIGKDRIDKRFTYLDIGTNDPVGLNNTYLFYSKFKCSGVCVEANPLLIKKIELMRKRDIILNVGLSDRGGMADFFVMDNHVLSTFSKEDAEEMEKKGLSRIKEVKRIPITTFDKIVKKHMGGKCPDLVSMDVEGYEMKILESIDFSLYRPRFFVLETVDFTTGCVEDEVIQFMVENGYKQVAWTTINSIFVDKEAVW